MNYKHPRVTFHGGTNGMMSRPMPDWGRSLPIHLWIDLLSDVNPLSMHDVTTNEDYKVPNGRNFQPVVVTVHWTAATVTTLEFSASGTADTAVTPVRFVVPSVSGGFLDSSFMFDPYSLYSFTVGKYVVVEAGLGVAATVEMVGFEFDKP